MTKLALDAEAFYGELKRGVQALRTPDTRLVGITSGGAWLAERVWEQQLTADLADAGATYTILDDAHFLRAGLRPDQLTGYHLTEDEGRLLAVFPGNERLRYLMPFAPPEETIVHLRTLAETRPGATIVFADDGEKFGFWPGTHELCHAQGWLRRFFDQLEAEPVLGDGAVGRRGTRPSGSGRCDGGAHSRLLPCRTSSMKLADFAGVPWLTEAGGCQVDWIAPEMSLQYGVTGRGPASFTLCWNRASRSAG